jgi:hypothetical protein
MQPEPQSLITKPMPPIPKDPLYWNRMGLKAYGLILVWTSQNYIQRSLTKLKKEMKKGKM